MAKEQMTEAQMDRITNDTAKMLAEQPKVKIRLHLDPEERRKLEAAEKAGRNAVWPSEYVAINGYGFQIQLGKEVEVPQSVAEVLKQAGLI